LSAYIKISFKGIVYRAHKPVWASSPLSGEGAKVHGGRFNPKGVAALYTAIEQITALAEHQQGFPHRPQPITLCAYEVDCSDLVDLTDPKNLDALNIKETDLSCAWEIIADNKKNPPSWKIAEELINDNVAGIIVPSYARNTPVGGKNIVFWHWEGTTPHKVIVIDDEKRLSKN